jgi:hypothetical protein
VGYSMTLVVLLPQHIHISHREKEPSVVVWEPSAMFTSRVERFENDRDFEGGKLAERLAHACILSWVHKKILPKRNVFPERESLAPIFSVPEDDHEEGSLDIPIFYNPDSWLRKRLAQQMGDEQFVFPLWSEGDETKTFPTAQMRREHNKIVSLSKEQFKKYAAIQQNYSPAHSAPFQWAPASMVSGWLYELEQPGGHSTYQLIKDSPAALAHIRAYRLYLGAMGDIGARVLVAFEQAYSFPQIKYF